MKNLTIYKGHLPGSLGLLEVGLGSAGNLAIEYTPPGADSPKKLPAVQNAIDQDFDGQPLIARLNYGAFLNQVLVEGIKAATKAPKEPVSRRPGRQGPRRPPGRDADHRRQCSRTSRRDQRRNPREDSRRPRDRGPFEES